jgi:hypothetical protein
MLDAIDAEIAAADALTRACARRGAIEDSAASNDNPMVTALRRNFRASALTPFDMLATLGRMK